MKKFLSLIVVLMLAFGVKAQTTAPDFDCYDEFGRNIHLYDVLDNGQYAFLYFFFTETEDPEGQFSQIVAETYYNYGANQDDVYFIGIDPIGDTLTAKRWSLDYQTDFPIIHKFTEGSDVHTICAAYGVQFFATVKLVAPDRRIIINDIWPVESTQHLISEIDAAIAKHKGNNGEEGEDPENPGGDDPSDDEEITCTITAVANPEEGGTITGAGTYMKDMTVKLKAKANEGYEFLNWTENDVIVSIDAEYLFEITKDRNLVANFEGIEDPENPGDDEETTFTITAVANPEEGGTITGAGAYMKDMTVKLKAKANEGYEFLNWTENDVIVSIDAEYLFEITKDRNLVANFEETNDPENPGGDEPEDPENPGDDEETTFIITAVANPEEGGTITGAGVYEENENVTLTATANECYQFVNWTEDGEEVSTNVKYSFKVTEDRELVANFELKTYDVVISVNPEDAGTVTGAGTYLGNQEVTLTATPISGYRFVNWLEDGVVLSTEAEYTFTVTKDRAIIANFVAIGSNLLTVTINPKEAGEVEGAGAYTENSTVTLKATAEASYKFVNWTENDVIVSTEKEYTFVLTSDRNLVANFAAIKYDVTVVVDPEEAGEVEGAGTYQKNMTVTLTAKANEGYKFVSWTEDDEVVSTDEEYSFVIKRDRELTANFVSTEGIEENASAFNIYPNPVNDKLYIETLTQTQTLTVEIYDVYGRQQSTVNGQQPTVIDVTNLNSGVYFVMIKTNEGVVKKRFVKN